MKSPERGVKGALVEKKGRLGIERGNLLEFLSLLGCPRWNCFLVIGKLLTKLTAARTVNAVTR